MRLSNKIAIVTGAGSGFGEGIARTFAREGANVVVNDLDEEKGRRVANSITAAGQGSARAQALFFAADVTDDKAVAAMVRAAEDRFGGLDIMVNNAGYTHRNKPMLEVTDAEFDRIFAVNVKALFLAARHAVPALERRGGGVILTTASTAGLRPRPGLTWYNSSKGAAITATKSMAVELAPAEDPRQRAMPGDRGNRHDRRLHGRGHARTAASVRRRNPARPHEPSRRHRQCGPVAGIRRGGIHHRRGAGGGRRALRVGSRSIRSGRSKQAAAESTRR